MMNRRQLVGLALAAAVAFAVVSSGPAAAAVVRIEGESTACTNGTVQTNQVVPAYSGSSFRETGNTLSVTCTVTVPAGEVGTRVRLGSGQSATDAQRIASVAIDGEAAQTGSGPATGTSTLWVFDWVGELAAGTHSVVLRTTNSTSLKVDYLDTTAAAPVATTTTTAAPAPTTTAAPAPTTTTAPAPTTTTAPVTINCTNNPPASGADAASCQVAAQVDVWRAESLLGLCLLVFLASLATAVGLWR